MSPYDGKLNSPEATQSGAQNSQAQVPGSPAGSTGKEPSGAKGDDPSTAGPGNTGVKSNTSENKQGHLNPSAPEDANVTPGSTGEK